MVTDPGTGCPRRRGPAALSSATVSRTDAPLESVLDAVGDDQPSAAVIIDGDIRTVRRAGSVARKFEVPVLWWCDGPPADEIQRDTAGLVDAVLSPVDETGVGRFLAVGAGIDTRALPSVPLRLARRCGSWCSGGRSIRRARGAAPGAGRSAGPRGGRPPADRRLAAARRRAPRASTLESLVADLMLTQSVELLDADGPLYLPEVIGARARRDRRGRRARTGPHRAGGDGVRPRRPLVASRARQRRWPSESLPLVFATGDAASLATCIAAVADARQDELADLGTRLRHRVAARALARPVGRRHRRGDRGLAGPLSRPRDQPGRRPVARHRRGDRAPPALPPLTAAGALSRTPRSRRCRRCRARGRGSAPRSDGRTSSAWRTCFRRVTRAAATMRMPPADGARAAASVTDEQRRRVDDHQRVVGLERGEHLVAALGGQQLGGVGRDGAGRENIEALDARHALERGGEQLPVHDRREPHLVGQAEVVVDPGEPQVAVDDRRPAGRHVPRARPGWPASRSCPRRGAGGGDLDAVAALQLREVHRGAQ